MESGDFLLQGAMSGVWGLSATRHYLSLKEKLPRAFSQFG